MYGNAHRCATFYKHEIKGILPLDIVGLQHENGISFINIFPLITLLISLLLACN